MSQIIAPNATYTLTRCYPKLPRFYCRETARRRGKTFNYRRYV